MTFTVEEFELFAKVLAQMQQLRLPTYYEVFTKLRAAMTRRGVAYDKPW